MGTNEYFKRASMRSFIVFLLAVFVWTTVLPEQAEARNWFDRFGNSVVTHRDSAWSSQRQGHYAAGGFSVRMAIDRTPLFTITPPRFQVGCGGIDAFWGGFSFLNAEWLIQKLRNIMQAAPMYAFQMALQTLCPACAELLATLEAIANQLNSLALDDCEGAKVLGGGAFFLAQSIGISAGLGSGTGSGANFLNESVSKVNSWLRAGNDGVSDFRHKVNEMLDWRYCHNPLTRDKCREQFQPSGTLWGKALQNAQHSEQKGTFALDSSTVGFLRALYGDVDFVSPDHNPDGENRGDGAREGNIRVIKNCEGSLLQLIGAMVHPSGATIGPPAEPGGPPTFIPGNTNIMIQVVAPPPGGHNANYASTSNNCMEVNINHETMGLPIKLRFGYWALSTINAVSEAFRLGTTISDEYVKVINESFFPIYSHLNLMNLRRGGHITPSERDLMAEMLAASHAIFVLTQMSNMASEVIREARPFYAEAAKNGSFQANDVLDALGAFEKNISDVQGLLHIYIDEARKKYQTHLEETIRYFELRAQYQTIVARAFVAQ
jgi:hypothetical protein